MLRLREEFDLADAAAPKLDVVTGNGDRAVTAMGVDLPLDRMNVFDGSEIEIAPPHERFDRFQEFRSRGLIAGTGARLDERGALPVLSHALVIVFRSAGRDRHLRRAGIGPEAQIDAEDVAVDRRLREQLDEAFDDVDGGGARVVFLDEGKAFRVVEHDEIDVARIVELVGAVFSHREHDEAGLGFETREIANVHEGTRSRLAQEKAKRRADRRVREQAQGARHLADAPEAGHIGQRHNQRHLALGPAQDRHGGGLVFRVLGGPHGGLGAIESRARARAYDVRQRGRFACREACQERTVAEGGFEDRAGARRGRKAFSSESGHRALGAGGIERTRQRMVEPGEGVRHGDSQCPTEIRLISISASERISVGTLANY